MTLHFRLSLFVFIFIILGVSSCNSDGSDPRKASTFWKEAKLNDFPLNEVDYLDIDITHPEISNGIEISHGAILITIPFSQQSLTLSLREFDRDQSKYTISPTVGELQDFSTGAITYIISDVTSEQSVHYDVTIVQGGDPFYVNTRITGFRFEKEKNPSLTSTVEATKIAEYENYSKNAIYVIVPEGTDFTTLIPTVEYDAARLYYSVGGEFVLYPSTGLTIDFNYPKRFQLQAENSSGTKSRPYTVIVDIANPIAFNSPVITGNVKTGTGSTDFFGIATWTNQGNHPITGMSPIEYRDRTYPVTGLEDVNIITATLQNPNGGTPGVLPGESGQINVRVKRLSVAGLYTTTAVFTPTFSFDTETISFWPIDERVEEIFLPRTLKIESTIEE